MTSLFFDKCVWWVITWWVDAKYTNKKSFYKPKRTMEHKHILNEIRYIFALLKFDTWPGFRKWSYYKTIGDAQTKNSSFVLFVPFLIAYEHSPFLKFGFISSFKECIGSSVWRNHKLIVLCTKTFVNGYELRKKTLQRNLSQRKHKVIGLS